MRRLQLTLPEDSGGGGGARVKVTNQNIASTASANPCQYRLNSSGAAQKDAGAGSFTNISGQWLVTGASSDYECMFHVNTGSLTSGTEDTWQALSTSRTWTKLASIGTTASCNGTVSIRDAVTLDVLDTALITLNSDNT